MPPSPDPHPRPLSRPGRGEKSKNGKSVIAGPPSSPGSGEEGRGDEGPALRLCRRPQPRRPSGRPGPEEVVAADGAEGVEDLAAEEEAGIAAALERPRIDLGESDAAAGDLGFAIPLVARPRQRIPREEIDQPPPLLAAELMVGEATRRYEAGLDCGAEANMAKMLAADASWDAANACVQTHGGFAFAEEYDVGRKFRETRLYSIAPVSNNLVLAHIGQHVLGMPRSY